MTYELIGTPRIENEYCDEYETTMVIDLMREDGVTGDVWIIAGVPDYNQDSAKAAATDRGYETVRVYGDCVDVWCPKSFRIADEVGSYRSVIDGVVASCQSAAIKAHRERMAEEVK